MNTRTLFAATLIALATPAAAFEPNEITCAGNGDVLNRTLGYVLNVLPDCEQAMSPMNPSCGALVSFAEMITNMRLIDRYTACVAAEIPSGEHDSALADLMADGFADRLQTVSDALD